MKCDTCGKDKRTVTREPSASNLILGPYQTPVGPYVKYVNRCQSCDTKLGKKLMKMIG